MSAKKLSTSTVDTLRMVFSLISLSVALGIPLFASWSFIPSWVLYTSMGIIGLALVVSLILGLLPAVKLVNGWVNLARIKKRERQCLVELSEIIHEARMLFESHMTYSLQYYLDSVCNAVVQEKELHSQIKGLVERLRILSNWHQSLLTFTDSESVHNASFSEIIRDITRFYHDLAGIVRELVSTRIHKKSSVSGYDDNRRMVQDKYNQHIGKLEYVLGSISKLDPNVGVSSFYRF